MWNYFTFSVCTCAGVCGRVREDKKRECVKEKEREKEREKRVFVHERNGNFSELN